MKREDSLQREMGDGGPFGALPVELPESQVDEKAEGSGAESA